MKFKQLRIDEETHKELQLKASSKGTTLNNALRELLKMPILPVWDQKAGGSSRTPKPPAE